METIVQGAKTIIPKFNFGQMVKSGSGVQFIINKIELHKESGQLIYNETFYEKELSSQTLLGGLSESRRPIFAYEKYQNGAITLSTRDFGGNQYMRKIEIRMVDGVLMAVSQERWGAHS